jgi:hypothetical protein
MVKGMRFQYTVSVRRIVHGRNGKVVSVGWYDPFMVKSVRL